VRPLVPAWTRTAGSFARVSPKRRLALVPVCALSLCTGAVLLSVPVSVRLKRYTPLAYAGLSGTLADLLRSHTACAAQRRALEQATAALQPGE